ncbi:hypothetical protein GCM10029976_038670 [Kribbella albertanoniae]
MDGEDTVSAAAGEWDGDEFGGRQADRVFFGALDDRLEYGEPVGGGAESEHARLSCCLGEQVPPSPGGALVLEGEDGCRAVCVDGLRAQVGSREWTLACGCQRLLDCGEYVGADCSFCARLPLGHEVHERTGVMFGRPVHEGRLLTQDVHLAAGGAGQMVVPLLE